MGNTVPAEEPASALFPFAYVHQASLLQHLPRLPDLGPWVSPASLLLCHPKPPSKSPELSLELACACPLPTSQSGPVSEPAQQPSLQNPNVQGSLAVSVGTLAASFHSQSFIPASDIPWLSPVGWQCRQGDRTQHLQHPWGHLSVCGAVSYLALLFNLRCLQDKGANTLQHANTPHRQGTISPPYLVHFTVSPCVRRRAGVGDIEAGEVMGLGT